jgi:Domain of unknown function (DUF4439)
MTSVDALQTTLTAEHAAVYVFGVLGGRASTFEAPVLRAAISTAYDVHLERRDHLAGLVREAGAVPVVAAAVYELPHRLGTPAQVAALALRTERSCARAYAVLVAQTAATDRRWAVGALVDTAAAEHGFSGPPQPLPGVGDAG